MYRVLDEISEILGDRDFVTAEDIEQLQYMEQVYYNHVTCSLPGRSQEIHHTVCVFTCMLKDVLNMQYMTGGICYVDFHIVMIFW